MNWFGIRLNMEYIRPRMATFSSLLIKNPRQLQIGGRVSGNIPPPLEQSSLIGAYCGTKSQLGINS